MFSQASISHSVHRGCTWQGACVVGVHGERYASYWNAFLSTIVIKKTRSVPGIDKADQVQTRQLVIFFFVLLEHSTSNFEQILLHMCVNIICTKNIRIENDL